MRKLKQLLKKRTNEMRQDMYEKAEQSLLSKKIEEKYRKDRLCISHLNNRRLMWTHYWTVVFTEEN